MSRLMPPARERRVGTPPEERSAEVERFARAMEDYRRRSGRMFPTWCETLEVLRSLGYEKADDPGTAKDPGCPGRRVMVVREGPEAGPIGRMLADRGGVALSTRSRPLYEFASARQRDEAMDAVRQACGWTSVEPRG